MLQKVIRSGKHSLVVVIPARFIHALGVKAGDDVKVLANFSNGMVNIKFSTKTVQLALPTAKLTD
jgi:antitoxin component of MazEF toxin-antitoxin module